MARPRVFILTFCRKMELFYGTELIFKTLRDGFPNAEVVIVDNASIRDAAIRVGELARASDCAFEQIQPPGLPHHEFLEATVTRVAEESDEPRPLVLLDPDICLWKNCEEMEFEAVVAGKFCPAFNDDVLQAVTMPRLHSSFLWIRSASALAEEIRNVKRRHFDFDPFRAFSVRMGGVWVRYDTGASLFAALPDRISLFAEPELERYDHLFCGSHFDLLENHYRGELRRLMTRIHEAAKSGNLEALRGIWREQDRLWTATYGSGERTSD
jgi:hypothetical protein